MEHIRAIMDGILSKENLRRGVAAHDFFSRWEDVVGESLARQTRPLRISGGVLWVYVDSAARRHHLTYFAPRMLDNIRSRAPGLDVHAIRFTLNSEC